MQTLIESIQSQLDELKAANDTFIAKCEAEGCHADMSWHDPRTYDYGDALRRRQKIEQAKEQVSGL